MNRFLFLFIFFFVGLHLSAQINKIVPFDFGNPNAVDLTYSEGKYLIPVIYLGDTSTLITIINEDINYYHYNRFTFSTAPLGIIGDDLLMFAKDKTMPKGLKVCKAENLYQCIDAVDIETSSEYNFPHGTLNIDDEFLVSYLHGENGNRGHNSLTLVDKALNVIWQRDYNLDLEATYSFDLERSIDNMFLISYSFRRNNVIGAFAGVSLIDLEGNIIWDRRGDEVTDTGANIYHTQLSNGQIVLSYEVDRRDDPIFIGNEWYKKPTQLVWLSSDGEYIKDKYILGPRLQSISIKNVDAGNGDYFFAYGNMLGEDDLIYGLITKYSNEGDTIWSHKYQHSDYSGLGYSYFIREIIEQEDGTISVLSLVTPLGDRGEIWLFELNENGCYEDDMECDDYVIVGTVNPDMPSPDFLKVFPNPTEDILRIESEKELQSFKLYNTMGQLQRSGGVVNSELSTIDLIDGSYYLQLFDTEGRLQTVRFVKY